MSVHYNLIDVPAAHLVSTGWNVRVAVLDTGWGRHGKADDPVKGRVLVAKDFSGSRTGTADAYNPGHGHGTDVAEIVRTIAPGCRILVGKVNSDFQAVSSQWVEKGLKWALENGARVVNMSVDLGHKELSSFAGLHDVIKQADRAGVIMTCAAGNSGTTDPSLIVPAVWPEVVSVGELWDRLGDGKLSLTPTSCRGPDLDAVAPSWGLRGRYGTSFAAPMLAGAAVLYADARGPQASPAEFRRLLKASGRKVDGYVMPWCGALTRAAAALAGRRV